MAEDFPYKAAPDAQIDVEDDHKRTPALNGSNGSNGSPIKAVHVAMPLKEEDNLKSEKQHLLQGPIVVPPPGQILFENFLGEAPNWYKLSVLAFLIFNPLSMLVLGGFWTGWFITFEFIFTLMMSLHCYPFQPGGIIILEAVSMGMVSTAGVYHHVAENLPVLLLVIFMVSAIHFMREFLMYFFTGLLLKFPNKTQLSLVFMGATAFLSAFLDALTVTAVLINVCYGFYMIYQRVAVEESRIALQPPHQNISPVPSPSKLGEEHAHGHAQEAHLEGELTPQHEQTLETFKCFLRSLLMHAVVGTALGGTLTIVGEPQNLLIGEKMSWNFREYFLRCAPITLVTCAFGFVTLYVLEEFAVGKYFGYGTSIPPTVQQILNDANTRDMAKRSHNVRAIVLVQVFVGGLLVVCLSTHVAAVGLIGVSVLIILTSFNGIISEHKFGEAFLEAMPFTALLIVFFAIAAIIEENGLFQPMTTAILAFNGRSRLIGLYILNATLSAVSDNVFVATLFISEVMREYATGTISRAQLHLLGVTTNIATNIPSIATPNGQAAFLFLYTSKLAPAVGLTYWRMLFMALPYTIVLTIVSCSICLYLPEATKALLNFGFIDEL